MDAQNRHRKLVVAGLIVRDGRVLISQRRADQPLPLQWEFPGGKVELGESPQGALIRELEEELDVAVQVGDIWDVLYHPYPNFDLVMLCYPCRLEGDREPRCREVAQIAWCSPAELHNFGILPADQPLIDRLNAEGLPGTVTLH